MIISFASFSPLDPTRNTQKEQLWGLGGNLGSNPAVAATEDLMAPNLGTLCVNRGGLYEQGAI